jgi:hypothetical protein
MSQGHLSDILNGKKLVGREIAKKFESATGLRWVEFLDMPGEEIEKALDSAFDEVQDADL